MLNVTHADVKPSVRCTHRNITLTIRPGTERAGRDAVVQAWHRSLLHRVIPELIRRWEPKLDAEPVEHVGELPHGIRVGMSARAHLELVRVLSVIDEP